MNFDHFRALYDGLRIDPVIVCHLERELADALGAKVTRVFLSLETLTKQKVRHPDLVPEDYLVLRPALTFGEVRQDGAKQAVILFVDRHRMGYGTRAALKVTEDGRKIFATSFCRMNERKYRRELLKPLPILRNHRQI